MQWTVRLEARTSAGEVTTTELVTFGRPGVVSTLAEIGLMLTETKTLLAKLQASEHAVRPGGGVCGPSPGLCGMRGAGAAQGPAHAPAADVVRHGRDRGPSVHRAGKPISTSRAEGTVNQLVSARMNKRRQMRWSPRGAHRVLQVRAALLDGRFGHQALQLAA